MSRLMWNCYCIKAEWTRREAFYGNREDSLEHFWISKTIAVATENLKSAEFRINFKPTKAESRRRPEEMREKSDNLDDDDDTMMNIDDRW